MIRLLLLLLALSLTPAIAFAGDDDDDSAGDDDDDSAGADDDDDRVGSIDTGSVPLEDRVLGGGCDEQSEDGAVAALPILGLVLGASGMRRRRDA